MTSSFVMANIESHLHCGTAQRILAVLCACADVRNSQGSPKVRLITGVIAALVDLREKGGLVLSTEYLIAALDYPRYCELMGHPVISEKSRTMLQEFLYTVPGYRKEDDDKQNSTFKEQYGFLTKSFGLALSAQRTVGCLYPKEPEAMRGA